MSHDDDVSIVADHHDGVFECFSLGGTGDFWVCESDDSCAETVCSGFKGETCSCGWFKEECGNDFVRKDGSVRLAFKFLCLVEQVHDVFSREVCDGDKTVVFFHDEVRCREG